MSHEVNELLHFANSFADKSKKILKRKYLKNFNVKKKIDGSFVTDVDQEIESLFKKLLSKKFPNHGIIGEEYGSKNLESKYIWVIDPLDGTHSFISGKPLFGTLISCLKNNNPIIGVIDIPILNYRWYGGKDVGVYFNKKRCSKIKSQKMIKNSIISSTSPFMFNKNDQKKVVNIYNETRFPIFGTDCYAYGLLLLGKIDLIVEADLKPWDYMAQIPLIKELGGNITDWEGKDLNINSKGKIIASMSMNHHKKLIKFLK